MQNYIKLRTKNTYFSVHILFQELKQFFLLFVYNLYIYVSNVGQVGMLHFK
jgi:hypothetical protein